MTSSCEDDDRLKFCTFTETEACVVLCCVSRWVVIFGRITVHGQLVVVVGLCCGAGLVVWLGSFKQQEWAQIAQDSVVIS